MCRSNTTHTMYSHALFYTIAAWRSVTSFEFIVCLRARTKGARTFTQDDDSATTHTFRIEQSVPFDVIPCMLRWLLQKCSCSSILPAHLQPNLRFTMHTHVKYVMCRGRFSVSAWYGLSENKRTVRTYQHRITQIIHCKRQMCKEFCVWQILSCNKHF